MSEPIDNTVSRTLEVAIRLGIVAFILIWCFQILSPFLSLILWGAIIAVSVYSPFIKLSEKLNGSTTKASVIMTGAAIVTIILPLIFLSGSLIDGASNLAEGIKSGTLEISAPAESVKSWPVVGEKAFTAWSDASTNASSFAQEHKEQLKAIGHKLAAVAAGVGAGIGQFIVSLIIAGAFLAYDKSVIPAIRSFMRRLANDKGDSMLTLVVATIRSITVGVIGIALFQGITAGIVMMIAGVPAAGLIAFIIFVTAIAQIPTLVLALPIIAYQYSAVDPTSATIFMVAMLVVGLSDNVLKPLLLGRGVDAPMLVILLGAIGGMLLSGVVGLFTGSVILALGYSLLTSWLRNEPATASITK